MRLTRVLLGAPGLLLVCYGAWLLVSTQRLDQVREVVVWAAVAVAVHDGVVAPLTLLAGWCLMRLAPRGAAAAAVLLTVGGVTVAVAPVLIGPTSGGKNPTLLDRNYTGGWLAFVTVVVVVAAMATTVGRIIRARRDRRAHGTSHGGR